MMVAPANWRGVCGSTAASMAPSRRCKCQSSGRDSVSEDWATAVAAALWDEGETVMATIEREKTGKPAAVPGNDSSAGVRNAQGRTQWKNHNGWPTLH